MLTMPGTPCLDLSMHTSRVATATFVLATIAGSLAVADVTTPDTAPDYNETTDTSSCPIGTQLYDTENPDQGDSGVVCRSIVANIF